MPKSRRPTPRPRAAPSEPMAWCHVRVPRTLWREVQRCAIDRGVHRRAVVIEALRALVASPRPA